MSTSLNRRVTSLPAIIDEWLRRGEEQIDLSVKPSWLLSGAGEPTWMIYIPGVTRKVRGKWKGYVCLDWRLRVPGGRLTDQRWSRLLEHCQFCTIAHIECADARAHTPRAVHPFGTDMMSLAEHLIVHYPETSSELGLRCLSQEKVDKYVGDFQRHGTAGSGDWFSRWDKYLRARYQDRRERFDVEAWALKQTRDLLNELDDLDRRLVTNDPPELPKLQNTLSPEELRFARRWLAMRGWYTAQGLVKIPEVAEAIEVDLIRMCVIPFTRYHLRQFERCLDYRSEDFAHSRFQEKLSRRYRSPAQYYHGGAQRSSIRGQCSLAANLRRYAPFIEDLRGSELAALKLSELSDSFRGQAEGRTPTLPVDIAMYLYDRMIHWAVHYTAPLIDLYVSIMDSASARLRSETRRRKGRQGPVIYSPTLWESTFAAHPIPKELANLRLWQYCSVRTPSNFGLRLSGGGSAIPSILRDRGLTLTDAMEINTGVLIGLVAAFSIRRRDEIRKLHRHCLSEDARGAHIDFGLCKVQVDGIRAPTRRPIPRFLFKALQAQRHLADALSHHFARGDPLLHERLFTVPGRTGGILLDTNFFVEDAMNLFCDFVESPCDNRGHRWYLRTHECRRFGGMTFFHQHGEHVSLPALSWWMGHDDILSTWRYIREQLTGREVTALDVALTTQAILTPEANDGAERLREVVRRHFNAERIDLIDPEEMSSYLEMLLEEGLYYITPHTIETANGKRHVVLIHLSERVEQCQD